MTKQSSFRTRLTSVTVTVAGLLLTGGASAAASNDVVALKNALYGAGYDITNVSGTMDQSTRDALRAFQRDQADLPVTGELDQATKEALGMVAVTVAASPEPAAPAPSAAESEAVSEEPADEEGVIEEDEDGGWSFF
ncbi:MAG: peptidoglycan-binding domain-containing protein [Marinobacter sp.]|uniref:peptidoglycan-binding domain-containing protein n=1 Tax=Marinobacter sp. TaxID=50741 RepID=UPI00299E9AF8|nr:peptidoglycan-binding domain-containing protein [Marinobacter sp.]MDX1755794.1 peptidoglycan-binding domain-containing protein [Marinobacter sp.]